MLFYILLELIAQEVVKAVIRYQVLSALEEDQDQIQKINFT